LESLLTYVPGYKERKQGKRNKKRVRQKKNAANAPAGALGSFFPLYLEENSFKEKKRGHQHPRAGGKQPLGKKQIRGRNVLGGRTSTKS